MGCAVPSGLNLGRYPDPHATPSDFIYCYGYNCSKQLRVGLRDQEWQQIERILKTSKTAKQERTNIAKAIARMETWTGALAGTSKDQAFAPILRRSYHELDCIDETVNSHKYLSFFEEAGLLKFHTVHRPVFKGFFMNGVYPHNSAAVMENVTHQVYVIDSYVSANGKKPVIKTWEAWMKTKTLDGDSV